MLLVRVAATSEAVAATRSRTAKRDLLAAALGEAATEEIAIVTSYLSGSLRQRRTGIGWRSRELSGARARYRSVRPTRCVAW